MGLTVQQIQQRLARFEFEPLFVEDLGWQRMPVQAEGPALWQAHRGGAVIRVLGPDRWADGSFQSLCQLGLRGEEPGRDWLLIGLSADATRSLWCWSGETTESPIWHRRVVIRGQGDRAWAQRLMGLHYEGWAGTLPLARLLNRQVSPLTAAGYEGFQASWQTLSESLTAFPQAQDRRHYGLVLLSRLMAAAVLQKRGYLGGDEWYLHNHFGQSAALHIQHNTGADDDPPHPHSLYCLC
ncbi:MAG TPA: hypothetical protein IGR64_04010 [Leptolyngbyaceae cyanobacterium M65_K2018_010]|nr:hypothetical protein [Leptolyngbyaceae cyanobacterium M65_K2018_010]